MSKLISYDSGHCLDVSDSLAEERRKKMHVSLYFLTVDEFGHCTRSHLESSCFFLLF